MTDIKPLDWDDLSEDFENNVDKTFEFKPSDKTNINLVDIRKLNIPNHFTKGQSDAVINIIKWINDKTDFTPNSLVGAAGTGKTTVLDTILDNIKTSYIIAAPTHKAARIAGEMTKSVSITLHKLLGFRPNLNIDNFDPNAIKFDPLGKNTISNYYLVIIDEASMINSKLVNYINKTAKENKTKILYLGDELQLFPVGENRTSIALRNATNVLTEIVRQDTNNPLTKLLQILRRSVKKGNYDYIKYLNQHPNNLTKDGGYIFTNNLNAFSNLITRGFTNEKLTKNIDFVKYIAYTRQNVNHSNANIRQAIFGVVKDVIHEDDVLMANNTIVNEFNEPKIVNSEDYIVHNIVRYRNRHNIEGFNVQLRSIFDGSITPPLFIVDHSDIKNLKIFITIANDYINDAKRYRGSKAISSWKSYFAFKNRNLLLVDIPKNTELNPTNNHFEKDLDYAWSITAHKSQGSTYDNVFINLRNMIYANGNTPSNNIHFVNRLVYVAISRASHSAIIYL